MRALPNQFIGHGLDLTSEVPSSNPCQGRLMAGEVMVGQKVSKIQIVFLAKLIASQGMLTEGEGSVHMTSSLR
jgi:hypothetical protein